VIGRVDPLRDAIRGLDGAGALDDRAVHRIALAALAALRREVERLEQHRDQLHLDEANGARPESGRGRA